MIAQVRAALREVRAAGAIDTVHLPMSGSHSHPHHAYKSQGGDQNHSHEHTHHDDADHDHEHAQASANTGRHVRFQGGRVLMMSASRAARLDAAWERAARDARDIQKGQR